MLAKLEAFLEAYRNAPTDTADLGSADIVERVDQDSLRMYK